VAPLETIPASQALVHLAVGPAEQLTQPEGARSAMPEAAATPEGRTQGELRQQREAVLAHKAARRLAASPRRVLAEAQGVLQMAAAVASEPTRAISTRASTVERA
jgi:hypothetical protein